MWSLYITVADVHIQFTLSYCKKTRHVTAVTMMSQVDVWTSSGVVNPPAHRLLSVRSRGLRHEQLRVLGRRQEKHRDELRANGRDAASPNPSAGWNTAQNLTCSGTFFKNAPASATTCSTKVGAMLAKRLPQYHGQSENRRAVT